MEKTAERTTAWNRGPQRALDESAGALVIRAKAGDGAALGELYRLCQLHLIGYLRAVLRDHHEAEDVFHDVFLKLRRALPKYQDRGAPFSAWVMRITRNHLHDHRAKHARVLPEPSELFNKVRIAGTDRHASRINEMTLNLPASQRQAVFLRFQADLNADEIAGVLGISANAVRHLHHRALRSLRADPEIAA